MSKAQETSKRKANSAIFISSRIRLARNLAKCKFVNTCTPNELTDILGACKSAIANSKKFADGEFFSIGEMTDFERKRLSESGVASRELIECGDGRGVYVSADKSCAIMINEEDHLRIQAFQKGLNLSLAWRSANAIDDNIEKHIPFAFDSTYGYLTACPTNVGTGLRASVMMHLPALVYSDLMDKIARGLAQLGFAVRGAHGEGSESRGAIFQISNQQTLGFQEQDIIKKITKYARKIAEFEINARIKLSEEKQLLLDDKYNRSLSILKSCKLIDSSEAVEHLSNLRLRADMVNNASSADFIATIDEMIAEIQPARLQLRFNSYDSDAFTRDALRAKLLNAFASKAPKF